MAVSPDEKFKNLSPPLSPMPEKGTIMSNYWLIIIQITYLIVGGEEAASAPDRFSLGAATRAVSLNSRDEKLKKDFDRNSFRPNNYVCNLMVGEMCSISQEEGNFYLLPWWCDKLF